MALYNFYITNKDISEQSRDCLRGSWKTAISASLIVFLIFISLAAATTLLSIFVVWWISIPLGLFSLFIFAILSYGYNNLCLHISRQELPNKSLVFSGFSRRVRTILAVFIKRFILSIFWLIVLVFPVFIKNIGYSMATLLMADRSDIKSENVLVESKHIMKQNYSRYFRFLMSNFFWFFLILITAGIAWIWIGPLLSTKKALFYENLKTTF